jgi:uncharacterized protein (TIGR02646 family)
MARLRRPRCPAILRRRGPKKTQALCDQFDASPPHRDGSVPFVFDGTLYGHRTVRKALERAQHAKCGYCEARSAPLDVEHYRPKGSVRQARGESEQRPGYYWLAYEWSNLLLACVLCNQARADTSGMPTGKGSLFPLSQPSERARSHHDSLATEIPQLLHAYEDDFDEHIGYRQHMPIGKTERGRVTIDVLRLQGKDHLTLRADRWILVEKYLRRLSEAVLPPEQQQEMLEELWGFAGESQPYSSMVRSALRERGFWPIES